ncbi:MAG: hypothetical protein QNI84_03890 [Henriciella sp.]|nr:hypothetical protein [Henriciella sp.]
MLALQILAASLLALSAALIFMPQIVIYGPRALPMLAGNGQARFIGGFFVTALALTVSAPHLGSAAAFGGETVLLVAIDTFTLTFGLV